MAHDDRAPFVHNDFLSSTVAAWAALSQDVPLAVLQRGIAEGRLVLADQRTPEWFAAAASQDAALTDIAPELSMVDDRGLMPGVDLVRIYSHGEANTPQPPSSEHSESESADVESLALLRALADLEE